MSRNAESRTRMPLDNRSGLGCGVTHIRAHPPLSSQLVRAAGPGLLVVIIFNVGASRSAALFVGMQNYAFRECTRLRTLHAAKSQFLFMIDLSNLTSPK